MLRLKSSRVSVVFVVLFIFLTVVAECSIDSIPTPTCSRKCVAEQCNTVGIKYGKYCGVGYTGCPGETPCDDLDACCKDHDDCVGEFGMVHVKCHKRLKNCLKRVQKSGKAGFSKECPVSTAAPTMIQGMDLAIMLSQWGSETAI